ncbi:MAG: MoaD/ThiS family protein [Bacteroidota bacterium]
MTTTILFFGALKEITGSEKIDLQNIKDTEEVNEQLLQRYPLLKQKIYRIALNKKLIIKNELLNEGDIIALLPPFAGG